MCTTTADTQHLCVVDTYGHWNYFWRSVIWSLWYAKAFVHFGLVASVIFVGGGGSQPFYLFIFLKPVFLCGFWKHVTIAAIIIGAGCMLYNLHIGSHVHRPNPAEHARSSVAWTLQSMWYNDMVVVGQESCYKEMPRYQAKRHHGIKLGNVICPFEDTCIKWVQQPPTLAPLQTIVWPALLCLHHLLHRSYMHQHRSPTTYTNLITVDRFEWHIDCLLLFSLWPFFFLNRNLNFCLCRILLSWPWRVDVDLQFWPLH